ncbi:MAG TPA: D-alanyl-D-alanine carboxypeptidase, partial [Chitinophagaceae bacterium]|nr:D-alanyl-D-alanine carboxypeptidase [Chitinophagaceae bacterium]
MKRIFLVLGFAIYSTITLSQTVTQKLQKAFQQFESDPQLQFAISSLYVVDAKTGKPVFEKNAMIGLAPASTQKIITSVTAFEMLGKDYRYKTEFALEGDNLIIIPGGDPSFG